jgi:hypothetical protein
MVFPNISKINIKNVIIQNIVKVLFYNIKKNKNMQKSTSINIKRSQTKNKNIRT